MILRGEALYLTDMFIILRAALNAGVDVLLTGDKEMTKYPIQKNKSEKQFQIGELSRITGVKAGTIRFYESCGFLEPAERLPNRYRVFNIRHIYQVHICRLVFGGFVNKRLRKISLGILEAAGHWDLEAYEQAAKHYLQAVEEDIAGTERAIAAVMERLQEPQSTRLDSGCPISACLKEQAVYSKKQAAQLVGVTPEAVRNWERNGLLGQTQSYRRRFYPPEMLERMYVIRLLLDNGYSMMAIQSFFAQFDAGDGQRAAGVLVHPGKDDNLIYRADRYLETLQNEEKKARQLCELLEEMQSWPAL